MSITLKKINRELLDIDNDNLNENLVAVAVQMDENGVGYHSGIIIGVDEEYYLFHYTGKDVQLNNPPIEGCWTFCKELEIIDPNFSEVFLAHCEMIFENSTPSYGFIFDGSYWKNGKYFSESGISEVTTCVGFCISVIAGFIYGENQYFDLNDWNAASTEEFRLKYTRFFDERLKELAAMHPEEFGKLIMNHLKRITPSEYTASAYITDLPIRKAAIDSIISDVETAIQYKRAQ